MRSLSCLTCLLALACNGNIGEPPGSDDPDRPGYDPVDARFETRVWRLSPLHYEAEMQRLFGDQVEVSSIPEGAPEHHLTDIAANQRVDVGNAGLFAESARSVASWLRSNPGAMRCGAPGSDACVDEVLAWLPSEAFRRPVTAEERAELRALFDALQTEYGYDYAFAGMIRAVLLSPHFLYRTELGDGSSGDIAELTQDEIASLLAFALTDQGPDEALRSAGDLTDPDVREAQARRLMGSSSAMWQRFFWEWLHMATLESQGPEVGLSGGMVEQIREEYEAFVGNIVVEERGSLRDLLTATHTWTRPGLAAHYGAEHPGGGLARVELDPTQRGGLLTQAAWLVSHGKRGRANVVRRGMGTFVDAMCFNVTPPNDLDLEAELERIAGPDATVREIVVARGEDGTCGNCHRLADPIGLVFESFASDGSWQTEYESDGLPVETDITMEGLGDFDRANDFSAALVDDVRFQHCLVQRLAHFMVGVDVGSPGAITWTHEAHAAFREQDLSFEALVVSIVRHPAFIERSKP